MPRFVEGGEGARVEVRRTHPPGRGAVDPAGPAAAARGGDHGRRRALGGARPGARLRRGGGRSARRGRRGRREVKGRRRGAVRGVAEPLGLPRQVDGLGVDSDQGGSGGGGGRGVGGLSCIAPPAAQTQPIDPAAPRPGPPFGPGRAGRDLLAAPARGLLRRRGAHRLRAAPLPRHATHHRRRPQNGRRHRTCCTLAPNLGAPAPFLFQVSDLAVAEARNISTLGMVSGVSASAAAAAAANAIGSGRSSFYALLRLAE